MTRRKGGGADGTAYSGAVSRSCIRPSGERRRVSVSGAPGGRQPEAAPRATARRVAFSACGSEPRSSPLSLAVAARLRARRGRAVHAAGRAAPTVELVVAATTDVHGRLRGWDYDVERRRPARGLARAATIVDSLRDATPGRVVLRRRRRPAPGQPARLRRGARVAADAPHPVMAAMNAMRYDAAAIGNHEFNYGVPFLERAIAPGAASRSSPPTRYRADGSRAFRGVDDRRARRACRSASSARRRRARWSGIATTCAAAS